MKTRLVLMAGCLLCVLGCVDSPDSVAREYRNAINECMDALMFVKDEPSAHRMTVRVFKSMNDRFSTLDKKLQNIRLNRPTKQEFAKELFESDGVHLYLTELQVNRQRYALEQTRLRRLYRQIYASKREELDSKGMEDVEVDMSNEFPALSMLLEAGTLNPLAQQLHEGEFGRFIDQFSSWGLKDYDKLHGDFKKKRETTFAPKDIKLVY